MNIMTRKKLKLSALFLFGLGLTGIQAQSIHEAIPASGGNASGSGGTVSYSVGQIVYTNNTGTNGSVSQGVQQPYEISIVTSMQEANGINLTISAFPNPTTDYLTLKADNIEYQNLYFHLYDLNGKIIQENKVTLSDTKISMTGLPPATYFLKVTDNQKEVKTFKIVKN
jgi:hypothetical protein